MLKALSAELGWLGGMGKALGLSVSGVSGSFKPYPCRKPLCIDFCCLLLCVDVPGVTCNTSPCFSPDLNLDQPSSLAGQLLHWPCWGEPSSAAPAHGEKLPIHPPEATPKMPPPQGRITYNGMRMRSHQH